jgi:hypothetical protein
LAVITTRFYKMAGKSGQSITEKIIFSKEIDKF